MNIISWYLFCRKFSWSPMSHYEWMVEPLLC